MERLIGLASLREDALLENPERCVQSQIPVKRRSSVFAGESASSRSPRKPPKIRKTETVPETDTGG